MSEYWAITGLGYGRADTIEKAIDNYKKAQYRNFSHLSHEEIDKATWGRVWKAPEGATGFVLDGSVRWRMEDDSYVEAEQDQIVGDVGEVPEWAKA